VRLLLENHADVNVTNYKGRTALDLAAENGHEAVVQLVDTEKIPRLREEEWRDFGRLER